MTLGCNANYKAELRVEVKASGRESEDMMLCLASDSDHLYGLVISSLSLFLHL